MISWFFCEAPSWFQQVQSYQVEVLQRTTVLLLQGSVQVYISTTVPAGAQWPVLLQAARLGVLLSHQPVQEADVVESPPQDLVLAESDVRGVCGDEAPQLSKGAVHVLLPPTFPPVAGEPLDHLESAGI